MNSKHLAAIRNDLVEGSPALQRQAVSEHKPRLQQDLNRLSEDLRHQRAEHKAWCEAWLSRSLAGEARPLALPQDVRDARLATVMGWFLTLVHLGLDVAIALVMLINPLFLLGVSLVLIFGVKSVLLLLLDDRLRPQRTKRLFQRWVLWPSLVLVLLSAGLLACGRALLGALAIWLSGALGLALIGLGLGCMGLATELFCLAYLYNRSKYAERRYRATEREAVETLGVLRLVEQAERALQPPAPATQAMPAGRAAMMARHETAREKAAPVDWLPLDDPRVKRASAVARNGFHNLALPLVLPLLLAGALSLGGCKTESGGEAVPQAQTVAVAPRGPAIRVYVDWSRSESDQALAEAVQALMQALLQIAVAMRASEVTVSQFGENGWEAPQIAAVALPVWQAAEAGEVDLLYGQVGAAKQQAALADYQQRMAAQLKSLTAEKLLPAAEAREPRCTDVQGVLRRIAESDDETHGLAILLSDLHETCAAALAPVTVGTQAPTLVVMLLPERKEEAGATASHELYAQRRAEIARVYPGAVVIPHFGDLPAAVKKGWQPRAQGAVARSH